jgi:hypothetical protein
MEEYYGIEERCFGESGRSRAITFHAFSDRRARDEWVSRCLVRFGSKRKAGSWAAGGTVTNRYAITPEEFTECCRKYPGAADAVCTHIYPSVR